MIGKKYKVDVSQAKISMENAINQRIKQLEDSVDSFELVSVSMENGFIIIAYKYYDHGEEEQ